MNICYHYYTIKALAVKGGFNENDAQRIAHYSQLTDDFVLSNTLLIHKKPPAFFTDNGLAKELIGDIWALQPCSTGINIVKSVSHNYQKHTLTPFHFITPKTVKEIEASADFKRTDYRCIKSVNDCNLLVNSLMNETIEQIKTEKNQKNLMNLGLMVHTFADTFAHCNFSGFHGYENESVIKKAVNKTTGKSGISNAEILFYKILPSIGHGNVGSVPDICCYDISYTMKSSENSGLDYLVQRDNTESFAVCSRKLLDIFCEINGKPLFNDEEFNTLQSALMKAQYVEKEKNDYYAQNFKKVFPDIIFNYDKNEYMSIDLTVEKNYDLVFENSAMNLPDETLHDAFSAEANDIRELCKVHLKNVTEDFFDFNELAYKRVLAVTEEYRATGTSEIFNDICVNYINQYTMERHNG
ncbi:MAG: hypothetical protein LBM93_13615 [Oscillospiraceae bacterium]|jgi:hypothetical protein|nr:hypothetical protein [Oscillospiraceae bacterium]